MTFKVKSGINVGNIPLIDANTRLQLTDVQSNTAPTLNYDFVNNPNLDSRITFTRSSNATFHNASGLVTEANTNVARFGYDPINRVSKGLLIEDTRVNLMPSSERVHDTTYWSAVGPIAAWPNMAISPRGDLTAAKLVCSSGTAWNGAAWGQNITKPAVSNTYAFSVYVKAAEYDATRILIRDGANNSNSADASFYLANGNVNWSGSSGTFTGSTAYSEAVGDGWYRVAITTTTSTETTLRVQIYSYEQTASLTANGTAGIYAWGAQLETGIPGTGWPSSYIPTVETFTSRSSSASYQDSTDNLIKYAGVNLLTYSNSFSDASWSKGSSTTLTANSDYAPDGTNTAWRLRMPVGSGTWLSHSFSAISGKTYTFSLYIKSSSTTPTLSMAFEAAAGAGSGLVTPLNITATSSWTRYTHSYTAASTGTIYVTVENQYNVVATDVLIWGAQVEEGSTPTLYSATTSATTAAVRPAYNPLTKINRAGLLEPAATNLISLSTISAGWIYSAATTINSATAPDGTVTAATVVVPASSTFTEPYFTNIPVSSSTNYTFSIYVKRLVGSMAGGDYQIAVYDETNSAFIAVNVAPLVPADATSFGWKRIAYTFTTPATCTALRIYAYRAQSTGSGGTVYLWGAQVEAGKYATSYIPTSGTSATRNADTWTSATSTRGADIVTINNNYWFNNEQGTWKTTFNVNSYLVPFVIKGSSSEFVTCRNDTSVGTWNLTTEVNATSATANTRAGCTYGVSYSSITNNRAVCLNGDTVTVGAGTFVPSTAFYLGSDGSGNRAMNGYLKQVTYYPTSFSNTQLQAITRN